MKRYQPALMAEKIADEILLAGHPNSIFSEEDDHRPIQTAIHSLEKINACFADKACSADTLLHRQLDDLMREIALESPDPFTMGR